MLEAVDPPAAREGTPSLATPLLVTLPQASASSAWLAQWHAFARSWAYSNALTYLESALPHEAVMHALHARLDAVLPMDLRVVLRYFDTRTALALAGALECDQRSWLFAPATCWLASDRTGAPVDLTQVAPLAMAGMPPLRLTAEQEAELMRAAEPDAVIDALLERENVALMARLPHEQHQQVSELLTAARGQGVTELPDLIAYCELGLTLGAGFAEQEPWCRPMDEVRAGRMRFVDCVARVGDDA